ncbi:luciferase family oxidoreductase group 1 [Oceanisphaera litoralis]|uniref:LLM class flavin-dependent oxidoreductase n=1 Tax=Oceanisphaera litoralis TaxID=225144 RepID=UPI00195EF630|nr:LLM class flavin-dependent oxidoreductase [Oceanisphaera litoralis]MBM7454210.1 luciferase family oxidoreductase group 1 [Oceanisphaera litoralis]
MTSLSSVKLSILDLVHIRAGHNTADALADSVAVARHAEQLGFERFWLAEHHNLDGIASSATAVLVGHIAGHTSRIRVGSGGIMLPNHPPLVVAEQFGTLATLYPDRIDLGLGRAPGTDQDTMRALRRRPEDGADFPEQVQQLQQLLGPVRHGQKLMAIPGAGTEVPIWLLGSSLFSAQLAAQMGLPYAFASHFAPRMMLEAAQLYRQQFRPSAVLSEPYLTVGVPAIVADTDEEAAFLATTPQQKVLSLLRGDTRMLQPPVTDMARLWLPHEQNGVESFLGAAVVGSPERVAHQLEALLARTGANELMIVSDIYDQGARHHSLSLLAGLIT